MGNKSILGHPRSDEAGLPDYLRQESAPCCLFCDGTGVGRDLLLREKPCHHCSTEDDENDRHRFSREYKTSGDS